MGKQWRNPMTLSPMMMEVVITGGSQEVATCYFTERSVLPYFLNISRSHSYDRMEAELKERAN